MHASNQYLVCSGDIFVKYKGGSYTTSSFLHKKTEWKPRFCELLGSDNNFNLTVNKIKSGNKRNFFFKVDITENTKIKTTDLDRQFYFYFENDPDSNFFLTDRNQRDEWVEHIESCVAKIISIKLPDAQPLDHHDPHDEYSVVSSLASVAELKMALKNEASLNGSIDHGLNDIVASKSTGIDKPSVSFSDSTTALPFSTNSSRSVSRGRSLGLGGGSMGVQMEPVRKGHRGESTGVRDSKDSMTGHNMPETQFAAPIIYASGGVNGSEVDDRSSPGFAHGTTHKGHENSLSHDNNPLPVRTNTSSILSPKTGGLSPTRTFVSSPLQYSSNTPYSDLRRGKSYLSDSRREPDTPDRLLRDSSRLAITTGSGSSAVDVSSTRAQQQEITRQREVQALAAMNDQLNQALESSEEMRAALIDSHAREIAHLQAQLVESELLRQQTAERLAEHSADEDQRLVGLQEELVRLREDAEASKEIQRTQNQLILDYTSQTEALRLEKATISGDEEERQRQLDAHLAKCESMVSAARAQAADLSHTVSLKDRELVVLQQQLDRVQCTVDQRDADLAAKERELSESAGERDALQLQLNQANNRVNELLVEVSRHSDSAAKDKQLQDRVTSLEHKLHNNNVELIAFRGSEESYKLSIVRLESLVKEQQSFLDDMSRQLVAAGDLKKTISDQAALLSVAKEDALGFALEREKAARVLEDVRAELLRSRADCKANEASHEQQVSVLNAEVTALQQKLKQTLADEAHVSAELSVLQRHVETNKEQYLQLERTYHEAQRHSLMEIQSHAKQKQSLMDTVEASSATIRELQSRCKSLEDLQASEAIDARHRLQDLEDMLAGLRRTNNEVTARSYLLEEQVNKLTYSLGAEKSNHAALQEQYEALENQRHYETTNHQNIVRELQEALDTQSRAAKDLKHQLLESELFRRDGSEKHVTAYREVTANLSSAESSNKQLRDDMAALIHERNVERKALEDRIAAQMAHYETSQLKVLELERQLSATSTEKSIDQQKHATLEADLQATVRKLTAANEALEQVLHEEHGLNTNNRQLISSLRADNIAQSEEKANLYRDYMHYKELAASIRQELDLLAARTASERTEMLTVLEDSQLQLSRTQQTAEEQVRTLQTRCSELTALKQELSTKLQLKTESCDALQFQLTETVAARTELDIRCKELAAQLRDTTSKLQQKSDSFESLQVQFTEMSSVRSEVEGKCTLLQTELVQLQRQLDQSNSTVTKLSTDLAVTVEANAAQLSQLAETQKDLKQAVEVGRVSREEIVQLNLHINHVKQELAESSQHSRSLEETLAQREQTVGALEREVAGLRTELSQQKVSLQRLQEERDSLGLRIAHLEQDRIVQLEGEVRVQKSKVKEIKGFHQATSDGFKEIVASKDSELQSAAAKVRRLEESEAALRQTITSMHSKMAEMIPTHEANQLVEAVRRDLGEQLHALSEERKKLAVKHDAAVHKHSAVEKEVHGGMSRLRSVLASLSQYIETRDVAYEYKKSVGLAQTHIQFRDNTLEETVLSVEEHVGRLLRDFNLLRNAAVEVQLVLLAQQDANVHLQQPQQRNGSASKHRSEAKSPLSPSSSFAIRSRESAAVGSSAPADLAKDNKRLLDLLLYSHQERVSQLQRDLSEEQSLRSMRETLTEDLQSRIATYEDQVRVLKQAKIAGEQRHASEITSLQRDLSQYLAENERMQDEHARIVQTLTRSHEQKLERHSSSASLQVEQRIQEERESHQAFVEKLNAQFSHSESALRVEVDRLRSDCRHLQEQVKEVSRENDLKAKEISAAHARQEALQNEVQDKVNQLESCLSQLERAELKAAKEAREKLDLERVLRRFKSTTSHSPTQTAHDISSITLQSALETSGRGISQHTFTRHVDSGRFAEEVAAEEKHNSGQQNVTNMRRSQGKYIEEQSRAVVGRYETPQATSSSSKYTPFHDAQYSTNASRHGGGHSARDELAGSSERSVGDLYRKGSFRITEYLDSQKKRKVTDPSALTSAAARRPADSSDEEDSIDELTGRPAGSRSIGGGVKQWASSATSVSTSGYDSRHNVRSAGNSSSSFAQSTASRIEEVMRAKGWAVPTTK